VSDVGTPAAIVPAVTVTLGNELSVEDREGHAPTITELVAAGIPEQHGELRGPIGTDVGRRSLRSVPASARLPAVGEPDRLGAGDSFAQPSRGSLVLGLSSSDVCRRDIDPAIRLDTAPMIDAVSIAFDELTQTLVVNGIGQEQTGETVVPAIASILSHRYHTPCKRGA
jgi:hypothetical protein